jgi:hypothetical protein
MYGKDGTVCAKKSNDGLSAHKMADVAYSECGGYGGRGRAHGERTCADPDD